MDLPGLVLLEELVEFNNTKHRLQLTSANLCLLRSGSEECVCKIPWYDVYGVQEDEDENVVIYTMQVTDDLPREKKSYPIKVCNSENVAGLVAALRQWLAGQPIGGEPIMRRLLVIVNPCAGKGSGSSVFAVADEMFKLSGCVSITVQETCHTKHAQEIARQAGLDVYDGIVCVGGDGIINEVLNGLLERPDWFKARLLPIGVIPAGSCNAAATSLAMTTPSTATLAIIKGHVEPMDIMGLSTPKGRIYAHLEVLWALCSDADLGSECLRWLGPLRLELWSLWCIARFRKYPATLSWLPAKPSDGSTIPQYTETDNGGKPGPRWKLTGGEESTPQDQWQSIKGDFSMFTALNLSYMDKTMRFAPYASHKDGVIDLVYTMSASRMEVMSIWINAGSVPHVHNKNFCFQKCKAFKLVPLEAEQFGSSIIDVDGEDYGHGAVEGEVFAGLMRVYTPPYIPPPMAYSIDSDMGLHVAGSS